MKIVTVKVLDKTGGNKRQLTTQPDTEQALRGILRGFYASLDLEYNEADALIRPLTADTYSVRLATTRQDAILLALSVRYSLAQHVRETPSAPPGSPTPLQLTDVIVSNDLRLQSCGQYCSASGSFFTGVLPPAPSPPPSLADPCLNPCLQSTCLNVSVFGTCSQLSSIGCSCEGCCTNAPSPPPSMPPPPPPPPMLCSDECLAHSFGNGGPYARNSHCQDGAAGDDRVTGNTCAYGTDCTDCGPRYYMPPSPPSPPFMRNRGCMARVRHEYVDRPVF